MKQAWATCHGVQESASQLDAWASSNVDQAETDVELEGKGLEFFPDTETDIDAADIDTVEHAQKPAPDAFDFDTLEDAQKPGPDASDFNATGVGTNFNTIAMSSESDSECEIVGVVPGFIGDSQETIPMSPVQCGDSDRICYSDRILASQAAASQASDRILWRTDDDPVKFINENVDSRRWFTFKIGLTHEPIFRMFGVGPTSYCVSLIPHCNRWSRMWVVYLGKGQDAAQLETDLINKYIGHERNLNENPGGEGAQYGVWTFVYVLENSFSEFEMFNFLHRPDWVRDRSRRLRTFAQRTASGVTLPY